MKGTGKKLIYKPANALLRLLPRRLKKALSNRIKAMLKNQCPEGEAVLEGMADDFLIKEAVLLFWGIIFIGIVFIFLLIYRYLEIPDVVFERNSFGLGEKEVSLVLQRGGEERDFSMILEEQEISQEEVEAIYEEFFVVLSRHMAGENTSLSQVNQGLCFDDILEGYPFKITYQPENLEYISLNGSISEMQEKPINTNVEVTASYESYTKKKVYEIRIMPKGKKEKEDPFERVIEMLKETEKESRKDSVYAVPENYQDINIKSQEEDDFGMGIMFLAVGVLFFLIVHNYFAVEAGEKQCRKETIQDFSLIVHLLTLYMGAGLSFSSAIRRMSADYQVQIKGKKKRYAFEKIVRMDKQMQMGVSQKEACMNWGKEFEENIYQKLSITLMQVISKGAREARLMMEHTETEAFRQRIDYARKAGEEASTRLLFPMIVLLCLVMLLVMFPAIMRFRGF